MRPLAAALLLAGLTLAGWNERASRAADSPCAVGSAAEREDALVLRGVELALATGQAPLEDRFLDGGESLAAGRAPPVPALLAALARRSVLRSADTSELARLEPRHLARFFEHLGPLLGALGVVAVFLTVRLLHGGASRDVAGLLAGGLYALAPAAIFAEAGGRVVPAGLDTLLGCALLAAAHLGLRAREELDATTGALLGGPLAGLALVAAPSLAPLVAAWFACVLACPVRAGQGKRGRTVALAVVGAALVANLTLGAPQRALAGWPALGWHGPANGTEFLWGWPVWVLLPIALASLVLRPRVPERAPLAAWGALALAWALATGADAPGVRLAACVLFAVAAADRTERSGARLGPLAVAAAVLLAAPGLLAARSATLAPDESELARRAAWSDALAHLRLETPSGGPWNHPGARPDALVLCAPEVAVAAAVGARRAVFACALPRLVPPAARHARAREARALLDAPPDAEQLARRSVRYVLLGPGDPPCAPDGLAARLGAAGPGAAPTGFERVWASVQRGADGPAASLWVVRGVSQGR